MTQVQIPASRSAPRPGRPPLERLFRIRERGSTVSREVRGGITTFLAMAYVILLVPLILSSATDSTGAHLDKAQITTATAFAAGLSTMLMGVIGNVPLAAGRGPRRGAAWSPYQAAPHMTWPQAMGLVVLMGVVIVLMAATGLRTMIMNAIPLAMKNAISVGIGLFIAMIGLV